MIVCNFTRIRILKCISSFTCWKKNSFVDHKQNFSIFINKRNLQNTVLKQPWSVLFFGSDEFALESLKNLYSQYKLQKLLCRLEVVTAYKGKENCLTKFAIENGITIHSWPLEIKNMEFHIGVVVSFGHLIPSLIIDSFPLGMINVHGSLLPRWRGSSPIIHAIKNGDTKTGISITRIMPKKFDIGNILAQEEITIDLHETQPELYKRLAIMGSELLIKTMKKLPEVLFSGIRQNEIGVTYAPKIKPEISFIKWNEMNAKNVYDLNRALTGLFPLKTNFNNQVIKVFDIQVFSDSIYVTRSENTEPGTTFYHKRTDSLVVRCKDNTWVSIKVIGIPGRPKLSALNFTNGFMGGKRQKFCLFTS